MANFIDKTYFIGSINLPNLDNTGLDETLTEIISRYEGEVLNDLLGYAIAKEVTAAYSASIAEEDPIPLPLNIEALLYGKEYIPVGETTIHKWPGLVDRANKRSLFAYVAYFYYSRDRATHTGSIGELKVKGEKSKPANPVYKQVAAWNEAHHWVWLLMQYLEAVYITDFPDWQFYKRVRIARGKYDRINVFGL